MARQIDPTHIFHMYRKDGTAVFLHPFRNTDKLHAVLMKSEIIGHYGQEPRVESLTLFRNELYRQIEAEVKTWVADTRFIPRFLLSSLIFLVSYFLMSFVIRDPLPVIDELLVSLGLSILAYILLGRKDMQSEGALKRRIELRNKVDGIVFSESEFVISVENVLNAREEAQPEELLAEVASGEGLPAAAGHETESAQMIMYLEQLFSSSEYRQTQKRMKRLRKSGDEQTRVNLSKWLEKQKIDVPLFTVYWSLKDSVHSGS